MNLLKPLLPGLAGSLWVESQKLRRSKTLWISALAFALVILISGLFMFILKNPEQARRLGLLGAKAQFMGGSADWPGYLNMVLMMVSIIGIVIFGFIFTWIFGREFNDKTYYDLLALPTSRMTIVLTKFVTAIIWSLVLLLIVLILMLIMGMLLNLPGWSPSIFLTVIQKITLAGMLTTILAIPFSLIASLSKGYLPAAGSIFLVVVLGQVFSALGYSQFFPWSVPALVGGVMGSASPGANLASYISVGIVSLLGLIFTLVWWQKADHS